jgi:hypothetical protein
MILRAYAEKLDKSERRTPIRENEIDKPIVVYIEIEFRSLIHYDVRRGVDDFCLGVRQGRQ